jgi:hypothetical protein
MSRLHSVMQLHRSRTQTPTSHRSFNRLRSKTMRSGDEFATPNACCFQGAFPEVAISEFGRATTSQLAIRV